MSEDTPSVRLDDLLAHAGWVRRLAGSLVGDPAAADDLAQETLVAAWRRPPSGDRPVRPWLAGVVRNLARQWRRGEGRRQRRETSAAEGERPLPGPDELASRLEMQRLLAGLVAELDEPLRDTVILRYYEGLSSSEISRRQGVPAGTVRWRLKKAMDLLRERLDGEHDGHRAAWVALVLPLAEGPAPGVESTPRPGTAAAGTAAGLATGVVAMTLTTKLALGSAAVVLLALGAFMVGDGGDPGPAPDDVAAPAVVDRAPPAPAVAFADGDAVETTPAPPHDGDAAPAAADTASTEEPRPRLVLRVVDTEGRPAIGGWVRSRDPLVEFAAEAGADGRVDLEVPYPETRCALDFAVGARGRVTRVLGPNVEPGETVDLGDVTLAEGGSVSGRVVDPLGNGVEGAWVGVSHADFAAVDAFNGRLRDFDDLVNGATTWTGPRGTFRLDGVPTGLVRLWAGMDGWRAAPCEDVEVQAGLESVNVLITIEPAHPEDFVTVRVVDPSGAPVPHAELRYRIEGENFSESHSLQADDQGRWRIALHMPGRVSVTAAHPDDLFGPAGVSDVDPGTGEVVLRLVEARFVKVDVLDPSGAPVGDVRYGIQDDSMKEFLSGWPVEENGIGPIEVRVPAHRFSVWIEADGYSRTEIGPWDPDNAPREARATLRPIPGVTGTVTADGEPIEGATVRLLPAVEEGMRVEHNNFLVKWMPGERAALSQADGRFRFDLREDGRYLVRVTMDGYAPWVSDPLDLSAGIGKSGLRVELGQGGTIAGRVLAAAGHSPAGVIVGINRGDGYARTVRVGEEGAFRFERLTPGDWEVRRTISEIGAGSSTTTSPGEGEPHFNCRVEAGAVTTLDIDLVRVEGAVLEGTLTVEGGTARGWQVMLADADSLLAAPFTEPAALASDGRFRLVAGDRTSVRVVMVSPDQRLHVMDGAMDLAAGTTSRWAFTLPVGSIKGTGATPGEMLVYVWDGPGDTLAVAQVTADGDGAFALPLAPAGRGRLCRITRETARSQPDPLLWDALVNFEVEEGGSAEVTLPQK